MTKLSSTKLFCINELDAGFTLIQILVLLSLLSIVGMTFSQGMNLAIADRTMIHASMKHQDVTSSIVGVLTEKIQQHLGKRCFNSSIQHKFQDIPLPGTDNKLRFFREIDQKIDKKALGGDTISEALNRCKQPRQPSRYNSDSDNIFYWCMKIDSGPHAPSTSILASDLAFIETVIELKDLKTNTPVSCQKAKTITNGAVVMHYTIHWSNYDRNQVYYKYKNGFKYVAK